MCLRIILCCFPVKIYDPVMTKQEKKLMRFNNNLDKAMKIEKDEKINIIAIDTLIERKEKS